MRKFALALVLPVALLAVSCANPDTQDSDTPADEVSTENAQQTTSDQTQATQTPSDDDTSADNSRNDASGTDDKANGTDDETGDNGRGDADDGAEIDGWDPENPDYFDGVNTNAFFQLPESVAGVERQNSETDPDEHTAQLVYQDEQTTKQISVFAYYPGEDGVRTPIEDRDDPRYASSLDNVEEMFISNGASPSRREVSAGGLEWVCVEAQKSQQDGTIDHALCASVAHGRIIEVQPLNLHEPDTDAWHSWIDEALAGLGEAVVGLG